MRFGIYFCPLLIGVFLSGCVTAKKPALIQPELPSPVPKIALVLGGGAARGFAHVGVIRALEQEKIPIDMIVGTSVGSLIGSIYADTRSSFELEVIAFKLEKDDLFDFSVFSSTTGPVKGERLEKFVQNKVKKQNIEDLSIPFTAVATNLATGERIMLDRGSVGRAVRASSSIPGVFTPVIYQNMTLVDGGVVDNVAVDVARAKGADIVIAVNIGKNVINKDVTNILDITLQAVNIMSYEISKFKVLGADILIEPGVGEVGMMDFSRKEFCMRAGIDATEKMIPELRKKIEEWVVQQKTDPKNRILIKNP
ncbi:MAG: patatin-like phospholipase family protein [Nitrospirae bacterium]|nr:patatin-like phospholipase family protein [Nitrospirota bacterium]MBI3594506.1 patatin-like phospholipase family protein [Nitrospirota bacterium]